MSFTSSSSTEFSEHYVLPANDGRAKLEKYAELEMDHLVSSEERSTCINPSFGEDKQGQANPARIRMENKAEPFAEDIRTT